MADVRIELTCPGCSRPFFVTSTEQGTIAECPNCRGWVDVPELGRPPTTAEMSEAAASRYASEQERQWVENARQLSESARQLDQAQRGLDKRDEQDARIDRLLDRMESVIAQWEQFSSRIGRVMDRLEG